MTKTGWWFQPLWKILVSWDHYSQYMEKYNLCSKPPIRKVWPTQKNCPILSHPFPPKTSSYFILLPFWILYILFDSVPSHFFVNHSARCPFSFQLPEATPCLAKSRPGGRKLCQWRFFYTILYLCSPYTTLIRVVKPPPKQNLAPLYLLMSSDVRAYTHTLIPKCVEWDSLAGQSCISFCKILMCGYSNRNFTWVVHVTTCGMHL